MHMHLEIYFAEKPEDLEAAVDLAMAPFSENNEEEESLRFFDWWQIGGRWKGEHATGYDPDADPEHVEDCDHPNHFKAPEECFACNGTGRRRSWPTQWKPHEQDIIELEKAPETLSAAHLIVDGRIWSSEKCLITSEKETPFDGLVLPKLKELGKVSGWLVTVDAHS